MPDQHNALRVARGCSWWHFRWELLYGGPNIGVIRDCSGILRYKRSCGPDFVRAAIQLHSDNVLHGRMLKDDRKRRASRIIAADDQSYIVKEYRHPRRLSFFSTDQQGWLGSNRLVGSAECLGWQRKADLAAAYLLFRDVGDSDLYMAQGLSLPLEEAGAIYQRAGEMLWGMHQQGIYHADTKPSNFVFPTAVPGRHPLTIIDCDDIRVSLFLSRRRRLKNLAQFIGCLWCLAETSERVAMGKAFLQGYGSQSSAAERHDFWPRAKQLQLASACQKLYPEHWPENLLLLHKVFAADNQ